MRSLLFLALVAGSAGHGQMNYPPSTRQGIKGKTIPGALTGDGAGGFCEQPDSQGRGNPLNGACMLFSQPSDQQPGISIIPGEPTLNARRYRTHNVNVSSGPDDWTRKNPWRAPGASPVLGSGCGVGGGGVVFNGNGGWAPTGMEQGADPLNVLPGPEGGPVTKWARGSVQEVAFGVWANHGGGYQYRLCKNELGNVTEACFQRTPLAFADKDTQVLAHINGSRYEIPKTVFTDPAGGEWGRLPFPSCAYNHGFTDGAKGADGVYYCPSGEEFPEPLVNGERLGLLGFGYCNSTMRPGHKDPTCTSDRFHDFSVLDRVTIPADLEAGDYLVSWRWDCEQTTQIWQNCADVRIA